MVKTVKSTQGFIGQILYIIGAFVGLGSLYFGIIGLLREDYRDVALFIIGGLGASWSSITALTARYEVNERCIRSYSIWGERVIFWKDVSCVRAVPNFFGQFLIKLSLRGHLQGFTLFTMFLENGADLAQAIAEAAHFANPAITFDRFFISVYGVPPYGIFNKSKDAA